MNSLVFACMATTDASQPEALLLAKSIRTFAGNYSQSPIWVLVPSSVILSTDTRNQFTALDVQIHSYHIDSQTIQFPFAGKVYASAAAEALAKGHTELLVWMDRGSIVLREPKQLLLQREKQLGCRPVDHLLIGSPYDNPLDDFWSEVYRSCGVSQANVFPMQTSADRIKIRPYINAGLLVVRPEINLVRLWRDTFHNLFRDQRFSDFYQQDFIYQIFTHQALLTGCILSILKRADIDILSHLVNYPLHMHEQYPPELRPKSINELVSLRYEEFFSDPAWQDKIQVDGALGDWLVEGVISLPKA
jgi:hypothetical protein